MKSSEEIERLIKNYFYSLKWKIRWSLPTSFYSNVVSQSKNMLDRDVKVENRFEMVQVEKIRDVVSWLPCTFAASRTCNGTCNYFFIARMTLNKRIRKLETLLIIRSVAIFSYAFRYFPSLIIFYHLNI